MRIKLSSIIFRLLICIAVILIALLTIRFMKGGLNRSQMTNRVEEVKYKELEFHPTRKPDKESSISFDDYYLDFKLPKGFYSEKQEQLEDNEQAEDLYPYNDYLNNYDRDIVIDVSLAKIKDEFNVRFTPDMVIENHAFDTDNIIKDVVNDTEIMYVARETRNEENIHFGSLFIVVPLYINDVESPFYYKIDITEYDHLGKPDINNYLELFDFDHYKKN